MRETTEIASLCFTLGRRGYMRVDHNRRETASGCQCYQSAQILVDANGSYKHGMHGTIFLGIMSLKRFSTPMAGRKSW